jgi:hypothetical protein
MISTSPPRSRVMPVRCKSSKRRDDGRTERGRTETYRSTAGKVYSVRHDDYRYGDVALIVIVESVLRKVDFEGEPWWEVAVRWKEAQRYATDP